MFRMNADVEQRRRRTGRRSSRRRSCRGNAMLRVPDHQRHEVQRHRLHDRHGEQEHHRRAVHGEDLVVAIRPDERVARARASCRRISAASTPPSRKKHERGDDEAQADVLVVDGRERSRRSPARSRQASPQRVARRRSGARRRRRRDRRALASSFAASPGSRAARPRSSGGRFMRRHVGARLDALRVDDPAARLAGVLSSAPAPMRARGWRRG